MTPTLFLLLFLGFYFLEFIINWNLDTLNQKTIYIHSQIPDFFKGHIKSETFQKSREYSLKKLKFDKWQMIYSGLITLTVLFSGVLPLLQTFLARHFDNKILQGMGFFFFLFALLGLLRYPFGLYEVFRIEGPFGFNNMTLKLYLIDTLKSVGVSILIGAPLLSAILWFINSTGNTWWFWTFVFLTFFQILVLLVYPTLIAPLFNKFSPMEEGDLKRELTALTSLVAFPTRGIVIMDGSRRSTHSNAYFTGFGKFRRIVLFDTLISQMTIPEMKAILCHEIGHYKKGHIYKMLLFNILFQGLGLYLLSRLIDWQPLYQSFGFTAAPESLRHVGLFLFTVVASTFTFLLGPLLNYRSRKQEFEADAFAAERLKFPPDLETALIKLAEKNLSNLTPHPWYSAFHYSHPTIHERVTALRKKASAQVA